MKWILVCSILVVSILSLSSALLSAGENLYVAEAGAPICATLEDIMAVYQSGKENDTDSFKKIMISGRCVTFPEPVKVQVITSLGVYAGVANPGDDVLPGYEEMWMLNGQLKPLK